tara:strand:+ start:752 stop:1150 length:399 start_codon:yes stop_codon:yes gene_type:complete
MSKTKKDSHYALKVEHAIVEKYGAETVQHPQRDWSPEKEQEYLEQLKLLNQKLDKISEKLEKVEVQGVLMSKKLLNKDSNRSCPVCHTYSFDTRDNVYMTKYSCCRKCYIQWIEGREERWATGWRPNKGENK